MDVLVFVVLACAALVVLAAELYVGGQRGRQRS